MNQNIKEIKEKIFNSPEINNILDANDIILNQESFEFAYKKAKIRKKIFSSLGLFFIPYFIFCLIFILKIESLNFFSFIFVFLPPLTVIFLMIDNMTHSLKVKGTLKHDDFLQLSRIITKEEMKELTLYYSELKKEKMNNNTENGNVRGGFDEENEQYILNLEDLLNYDYKKEESKKLLTHEKENVRDEYIDSLYKK